MGQTTLLMFVISTYLNTVVLAGLTLQLLSYQTGLKLLEKLLGLTSILLLKFLSIVCTIL